MMVRRLPYRLVYDHDIPRQLQVIERKYHSLIRSTIEEQLTDQPDVETKNRKPLERPNTLNAQWELQLGRRIVFESIIGFMPM